MATATLTWKQVAAAIGAPDASRARSRWQALGFIESCSRCSGTGHHSSCQTHGTICFRCSGSKQTLQAPTAKRIAEAVQRIAAGALAPYFAEQTRLAAARKAIKANKAKARELYDVVGFAYDAAYRGKWHAADGSRLDIPKWLFDLQTRNNYVFWTCLGEIELALKSGHGSVDDAAPFFEAAIKALREIVAEYNAAVAST